MKSLILLSVLAASIFATVRSDQEWHFDLVEPIGVRFELENIDGIKGALVLANIYKPPYGEDSNYDLEGELIQQSNGWWAYQNDTTPVAPGDKIEFVVISMFENSEPADILEHLIIEEYVVPENATRIAA